MAQAALRIEKRVQYDCRWPHTLSVPIQVFALKASETQRHLYILDTVLEVSCDIVYRARAQA